MFDQLKFNIQIKYAILLFGIIGTLIVFVVVLFFLLLSDIDIGHKVQTLSIVFGTGVGLTTLVYLAASINDSNNHWVEEQSFKRKKYSSDFIKKTYNLELERQSQIVRAWWHKQDKFKAHEEKEKSKEEIRETLEIRVALVSILNFLEHMCLDIENGMADEGYLRDFFGAILKFYYFDFLWYIREYRVKDRDELLWHHLEKVAIRWNSMSSS